MKKHHFKAKQRFSLRKYAVGTCSVLLGTSLFFVGTGGNAVLAEERIPQLVSHYVEDKDLPESLKAELRWFEENAIQVEEGKDYYFVYRKSATKLPDTGLFSNAILPVLGTGILLVSLTLIKKRKGASLFLVTVLAVGGTALSVSALENLVELRPALVKTVAGEFLPRPERIEGYEFTGYYFVSGNGEVSRNENTKPHSPQADKVESTSIPSEGVPSLEEVKPELEVATETIAYDTLYQDDPDLLKGQTRVIQAGVAGERTILTEVRTVDGKETRKVVSNEVTTAPVTEIIAVGTKVESTSIPSEGTPSLVEVKPELEVTTEAVAYDTIHQDDPDLLMGRTRVVRAGVAGERTILTEVTTVDGKEDRQVKSNTVTLDPISEIIAVGTKVESTSIPSEGAPSLVEDKPELEVTTEAVAYETIHQDDPDLLKGETRVIRAGVAGERAILTEVTTVDGKETRKLVSNEITTAPVTEIIAVGTKVESTSIPSEGTPSLVEDKPELEVTTEAVAYDTLHQEDPDLLQGQTRLIQAGVAGERTILTEVTTVDGKEDRQVKSNTVTVEPVTEIIAVGTKVESTSIPSEGTSSLVEVKPELEVTTESVAYDTIHQDDPDLLKGQTRVVRAGVAGERTILTEVTTVDGKEVRQVKSNTVTLEPVTEIIAVGTKVESTSIPSEGAPSLVEEKPELEVTTEAIAYDTIHQDDPDLLKGETRLIRSGLAGERTILTEVTTVAGKEVRQVKSNTVTLEPISEIIAVGTKVESTSTPSEGTPSLVQVKPELEVATETVAYDTIHQDDPDLLKGQNRVLRAGVSGERTILTEVTTVDGKEVRQVKFNTVTLEPISEIIAVGTKVESTSIPSEGTPSLEEVKPELEVTTEVIAYDTIHQDDPDLLKGQTRVIRAGVAGERTILTEVTTVDGKEVRQVKSNTVTLEPVTEIIAVGTKVESTSTPREGTPSLVQENPELEVATENVAYDTIHQEDPDLLKGETRLIRAGVAGERTILTEVTIVDGKEVRQVKSNTVTLEPVTEIIAVGTKVESTSTPSECSPSLVQEKPELEVTTESVAYDTIHHEDPDLLKGQTRLIRAGVAGERTILTEVTTVDGKEDRQVKSNTVTLAPVTEIIAVGTKVESTSIPSEGSPSLVEEKPDLEVTTESVAYDTIHQEDPDLLKGQTRVIRVGVAGERTILTEVTSVDGKENRKQVSNEITTAPIPEIILVGTKKEPLPLPQPKVETQTIPYKIIYQADDSQEVGSRKTKTHGVNGQVETTTRYTRDQTSGQIAESSTSKTLVEKVDEIILVGSKPSVEMKVITNKTIYEADPALPYQTEKVAVSGKEGSEKTTTTYQVDAQTGQVTEREHQKEVTAPIDKVVKVGNVQTIVTPIPIKEERRQDPTLDKDFEKVESQGEPGETTTTRVYEVNSQTGELLSHTETSTVTKAMKPKIILVGSKENKPHLLPVNTELENAIDVRPASQGMKAVDLLSNPYVTNALRPNILGRDVISKKIELKKTNPTITDEEVKEVLRKEYLERLSIKDTLEETKKTLDTDLKKVVAHTLSVLGNTAETRAKVQADLEANKEKILLGLTYINRFYNIDFGKTNIRDILAYNPSSFGKKVTSLEWLTSLGSMSYDEMKLVNSPRTFETYFGKVTDKSSLLDFLDYNRTTFTNMDGDTWLKDATKAIVVEKQSKEKTDENVSLYTKLTSDPAKYGAEPQQIDNRKQYNMATLLGLVNIKEPSVYAITNMATVSYGNIGTYMDTSLAQSNPAQYKAELEKVKALVELTAERQAAYVDTLYRITKKDNQSKLVTNRLIVDTMKKYTSKQNVGIKETWSKEFGPEADKGVKDFMSPLGMYSPPQSVGAEANGAGVRYFIDRVLDDRGSATYSHEMTHLLDRTVLFNNYGRRDGTGAEFYARGIFENSYTPETDSYFNLNFVYDESDKDSFYNKTPERFKSAADLKEYMHGSFDVLYTLDYLEAEASRGLSATDKAVYFKQLLPSATSGSRTPVPYPNPSVKPTHQSEEIKALTEADASKLGDVHSLIDNHIVVNRYIIKGFTATGKVDANGYYTVDMFDTIYGVNENDKGMSGDISFRKQAFELMAGLGYYEGFVPYVSNQYKQDAEKENRPLSDQYIFEKILAGKTYAQFKKEQMDERIANISKLKPITIDYKGKQELISSPERMKQLMEEAVKEELAQIKVGNISQKQYRFIETPVQTLKKAIYKAYLKESNEFRNSIYTS
ncbi:G5 domain-containing protein [Streptococcus mitis]|uniref:G5 domain-containing protein n=1 Tax=Streptococcus mitis TaxID=28037 RepID=UPI001D179052|nr:G5 domain-containing protein [Streptococcus mitis]